MTCGQDTQVLGGCQTGANCSGRGQRSSSAALPNPSLRIQGISGHRHIQQFSLQVTYYFDCILHVTRKLLFVPNMK